ncbi:MAG: prepilin-type N-terminal cleavage/methylation domain-containing protein, partial [Phycisphaerae bacterium]|nr:prepilin-type N-terminal cleavage/methylation domain-containing protein [Phycisphaerae bacterium]
MRHFDPSGRCRSKGFTLIELMIVIAIILLLLAVLFPVVRRVMELSYRVECQNNLRQMISGVFNYAAVHDGRTPSMRYDWSGVHSWVKLPDGTFYHDVTTGTLWPFVRDARVYRCPIEEDQRDWPGAIRPPINSYYFNYGAIVVHVYDYGGSGGEPILSRDFKPGMFLMLEEKPTDTALGPASPCNDGYVIPNDLDFISDIHMDG